MSVDNAILFKCEMAKPYLESLLPNAEVDIIRAFRLTTTRLLIQFKYPSLSFEAVLTEDDIDKDFDQIIWFSNIVEQEKLRRTLFNNSGLVIDSNLLLHNNFFSVFLETDDGRPETYLSAPKYGFDVFGYTTSELVKLDGIFGNIGSILNAKKIKTDNIGYAHFTFPLIKDMVTVVDSNDIVHYIFKPKNRNLKMDSVKFTIGPFSDFMLNKDGMFEKSLDIVLEMKAFNKYVVEQYNQLAKTIQKQVQTKMDELTTKLKV